ncbi:hypothetical protein CCHR01_16761 [Colletotrichum chrysophilum]|uniref:Secreted protein n=1 Tax=Colletotrichum chrysophilum TaxID=1836956 RepID=A0AAD9A369_9PEZI|nr:hypothetical protein CCHR01_16761 [Colletotrichum chrysophilum]
MWFCSFMLYGCLLLLPIFCPVKSRTTPVLGCCSNSGRRHVMHGKPCAVRLKCQANCIARIVSGVWEVIPSAVKVTDAHSAVVVVRATGQPDLEIMNVVGIIKIRELVSTSLHLCLCAGDGSVSRLPSVFNIMHSSHALFRHLIHPRPSHPSAHVML